MMYLVVHHKDDGPLRFITILWLIKENVNVTEFLYCVFHKLH